MAAVYSSLQSNIFPHFAHSEPQDWVRLPIGLCVPRCECVHERGCVLFFSHVFMFSCFHVFMFSCFHVFMFSCFHVFMFSCFHVFMFSCFHVFMFSCFHVFMFSCFHVFMFSCFLVFFFCSFSFFAVSLCAFWKESFEKVFFFFCFIQGNSLVFLQNQELCESENFFCPVESGRCALRASLPEWRGERSNCEITKKQRNVIPYYGAWSCTLRSTFRMGKKKWRRRRKKNRVRCKNAGLQPHSHSTNPFFAEQKRKMAPQAKKNKGMVPLQTQRAKILRFHHSSHLGDLGVGRGAPKSAQKSLFFFFFSPKIQNYAMSHNSVYGAISLVLSPPEAPSHTLHVFYPPDTDDCEKVGKKMLS